MNDVVVVKKMDGDLYYDYEEVTRTTTTILCPARKTKKKRFATLFAFYRETRMLFWKKMNCFWDDESVLTFVLFGGW